MVVQTLIKVNSSSEVVVNFGPELRTFNVLQAIGLAGSTFILFTAFFSSVPRQATWYNFFICWMIFCISNLLLLFAGHAFDGNPDVPLCVAQSALTYAASPLCSAAALALVIQLYLNIRTSLNLGLNRVLRHRHFPKLLLISPYVIYVVVIIESLSLSYATPESRFFALASCSLEDYVPDRIAAAIVIILVAPILGLNVVVYLIFRKNWVLLRKGNYTSMFVRVSAFTLFGLITVIVGALFFLLAFIDPGSANKSLVALDIIYATIPVAGVCIFGTHKDLLHVCLFWRNRTNTYI
ncbi:hypothetical protein EV361DRAFT_905490 [Lentinula raphanica]|nr:hypothetical protein EV361DRAFT_905490 [Lentinula raphanica]